MRAVAARVAIVSVVPLLIAASDPTGDVTGCLGGRGSGAPDLVRAVGTIQELGTSARWELTFAAPLQIPDRVGHPFRVDIAVHDPTVPPESFAYYRGVNRIVRVDATVDHLTEIYLLPERATSEFLPPTISGRTMTIQVPGRTLTRDRELTGTSPGLKELRWTVIVRDGGSCDFLGDGKPRDRLMPATASDRTTQPDRTGGSTWIALGAAVAVGLAASAIYRLRRAR